MSASGFEGRQAQAVLRRLNALRKLSEEGVASLEKAVRARVMRAGPGEDLLSEGDKPGSVRMILSGWLCRHKLLDDGRRQIVSFILPGDTCDAHVYLLSEMDHSIRTLTPVVYSEIDRDRFEELVAGDQTVAEAVWCETLATAAIQREWTLNLGRRLALERVAHLLCEIFERLRRVGLLDGNTCSFPVTQMDMADATGLSAVHLNRTIQELRASGLITLRDRLLAVHDLDGLKQCGLFTPNYLHFLD